MSKDKIIDKLNKLYAKYESAKAIGNDAEADTFLAGFTRILNEHKLEMSDLTQAEQDVRDALGEDWVTELTGRRKRSREAWVESLAGAVARAYFCRIMVVTGSNTIILVGRDTDRRVAQFVLVRLVRFIMDESKKAERKARYQAWKDAGKPDSGAAPAARGFRASFINAAVRRLQERLHGLRKEEVAESNKFALVVQKSDKEVAAYVNQRGTGKASGLRGRSGYNRDGAAAGKAAGDRANISGDGVGSGKSAGQLR